MSSRQTDVRLGRIVRLLMDNATVVVSGTKIAEEIGTSRSEVWRLVQQLRTLGVEIAGHPATGYRLKAAPDLLLPDMLAPFLKGTIFSQQSITTSRLAPPIPRPWRARTRSAGRQRLRGRGTNRGTRPWRTSLGLGAIGRHLLLSSAASGPAAIGGADSCVWLLGSRYTPQSSRWTRGYCPT